MHKHPMCRAKRWVFLVVLGLLASPVDASKAQYELRALSNTHQEMVTCIAFYITMQQCIGKERDAALYQRTGQTIERLVELSARTAKTIDMTQDAMASRLKMSISEQMNLIDSNCVNISSLLSRYAERCRFVTERPIDVLNEYMNKR